MRACGAWHNLIIMSHIAGFRLIGIGLAVWTVAVAGSGASIGFWSLVISRMFVGVGEASFVSLASPFIGEQCMHGLVLRASIGRQVSSASVQQQNP